MNDKEDSMNFLSRARLFRRALWAGLLLLAFTPGVYAQNGKLGTIAVLPFTGGTTGERNGIPERVAFTPEMRNNFDVLLRTDITRETRWEQVFQHNSGMINSDDAVELGRNSGAEYVMTGSITALDQQKLLIISIINLRDIRQVAGGFIRYNSITEFTRDPSVLSNMASELVRMVRNPGADLPPLAVMPVRIENGVRESEGDAMAQLLAIYLLQEGKWAVCPRTDLGKLGEEYHEQLQSGTTRQDEAVRAGKGIVPQYVLAVVSRTLGAQNTFNGTITDLVDGSLYDGSSVSYITLDEGIPGMRSLARTLSGETAARGTGTDAYVQGEKLGAIAVLPFTGGTADEQNGIPERIAFTGAMRDNFRSVMLRTDITNEARWEQVFQNSSGMINTDDAVELGKSSGAEYVMTGSITALAHQKLLIVSIINLRDIRQVAGGFLRYDSITELTGNLSIMNNMASDLVGMIRNLKEDLLPLAVMPVRIENGVRESEGDAMAQLLAIYLLQEGKWAVCPRTNLDKLREEYHEQMQSGTTREDEAAWAGDAMIPQHVLAVVSRTLGTQNTFNGTITELVDGSQYDGSSVPYTTLDTGIMVMRSLARVLSGGESTTDTDLFWDKVLKNSGIAIHGWAGLMGAGDGDSTTNIAGGGIEVRVFYFGIQTGVTRLNDQIPYTPQGADKEQYLGLTTTQVPLLLRLTIGNPIPPEGQVKIGLTAYGGIGLNLSTGKPDFGSVDPAGLSLIFGGGLEWYGRHFRLSVGGQYNGDISASSLTIGGVSYDYTRVSGVIAFGITWYIPFRKS
jgi:hypothetical protein